MGSFRHSYAPHYNILLRGRVPLLTAAASCTLLLLVLLQRPQCGHRCDGGDGGGGRASAISSNAYVTYEVVLARAEQARATAVLVEPAAAVAAARPAAAGAAGAGAAAAAAAAIAVPTPPPLLVHVGAQAARAVLPLTNLSSLTTAALLDSRASSGNGSNGSTSGNSGAPPTPAEARALVRLHQDLHCAAGLSAADPPNSTRVMFGNVTLFLYAGNDIVSDNLKGPMRSWEGREMREFLAAMRAPVPTSSDDLKRPDLWRRPSSPFVVDVGANVGWFAVNGAAAGGTVAAFEAMAGNVALLRATLCANPWLSARVALYGVGLGARRADCHVLSGAINRGDGHTLCGEDPQQAAEAWRKRTGHEYVVRGGVSLARLDALVDHDVHVMKIDVEGYEAEVLRGAEALFKARNVWFLLTECNAGIIGKDGQLKFLRQLDELGYYCSAASFAGPFIAAADLRAGRDVKLEGTGTVYCVKKALEDARPGAVNGGGGGGGSGRRRRRWWRKQRRRM